MKLSWGILLETGYQAPIPNGRAKLRQGSWANFACQSQLAVLKSDKRSRAEVLIQEKFYHERSPDKN